MGNGNLPRYVPENIYLCLFWGDTHGVTNGVTKKLPDVHI